MKRREGNGGRGEEMSVNQSEGYCQNTAESWEGISLTVHFEFSSPSPSILLID